MSNMLSHVPTSTDDKPVDGPYPILLCFKKYLLAFSVTLEKENKNMLMTNSTQLVYFRGDPVNYHTCAVFS